MKLFFLALTLFILVINSSATNYYISSSNGDDSNNGLSSLSPWKTIAKVNSMMNTFIAGDNIFFKRGDVFRGQITVTKSGTSSNPITFSTYGTGAKPIILGSENITNWVAYTSSIQKSIPISFTSVTQLYLNNEWQVPCRYPNGNSNFLTIDAVSGTSPKASFSDADLSVLGYSLVGAICFARTSRFNFERRTVATHNAGSNILTLNSNIAQTGYKNGWGYFLTNKLEFLDTLNEWYFNPNSRELFYYGNSAPSNVEASVYNYGVYISTDGATDIVIDNLAFKYQQFSGVAFWRNNNRCIVQDCDFNYAGETAINVYRVASGIVIQRNSVNNAINKGIGVYNVAFSQINNNSIQNCGMVPGYGSSNPQDLNDISINNFTLHNGTGISVWEGGTGTTKNIISENVISNTCYSGIQMRSYNSLLSKNSITNYCNWLDDGGGLYFRLSGNMISNNFVKDGIGNLMWTTDSWVGTTGLYLDDLSSKDTIIGNTSENSNTGLYIHNARLNVISDNILYNNKTQLEIRDDDLDAISNNCDSNIINNNVMYCLNKDARSLRMFTNYSATSLAGMGISWTNNYFFNPYSYTHINRRWQTPNVVSEDLAFWQWKSNYAPTVTYNEGYFKALAHLISYIDSNIVINGTMNFGNPPTNWTSFSGVTLSQASGNLLDGFSLKVSNSSANPGRVLSNSLTLKKDQLYYLKFSVSANANGNVKFYPLQNNIGYVNGPDFEQTFPFINATRKDYSCVFQIKRSTVNGNLFFANDLQFPEYFLDNVELREISGTFDDVFERSKIFKNITNSPVSIAINEPRYTIDNILVGNNITIPPFSSIILIKKDTNNSYNSTWLGMTSTDWNVASNWNKGVVPNFTDTVTIPATINNPIIGNNLNVQVARLSIADSAVLTINGSATLNASSGINVLSGGALVGNSNNIFGNVTLQQKIVPQRGWRIFANPFISSQSISTIAANNNIPISIAPNANSGLTDSRAWNNNSNSWENVTTTTWLENKPYALFIRGLVSDLSGGTGSIYIGNGPSAFIYKVSGTLNGSVVTIPQISGNFSIVGNPFSAPVTTQSLTGGTSKMYYYYQVIQTQTPKITSGSWIPVGTGPSNRTSTIPVLGAIAYLSSSNDSFSIRSTDINTVPQPQANMFGIEPITNQFEISIEQNGNFKDKLFVRLDSKASLSGIDNTDLPKLYNDNVNIYTLTPDNKRMAIDSRNTLNTIPIGISATVGEYNLKLNGNNLPEGTALTIRDNLFKIKKNLNKGDVYPFTITTDSSTRGEKRFEISVEAKNTQITNDPIKGLKVTILSNVSSGNQIVFQITGAEAPAIISLKDISGRSVKSVNGYNGIQYLDVSNVKSGIFILNVSDGITNVSKKIAK